MNFIYLQQSYSQYQNYENLRINSARDSSTCKLAFINTSIIFQTTY